MSAFDIENYFDRRAAADLNAPSDSGSGLSKYDEVMLASAQKTKALQDIAAQRASQQAADAGSWASQLFNDPQGFLGTAVNAVATGVESAAREAGQMISAPAIARSVADEAKVTEAGFQAYARELQGKATKEDLALLNQRTNVLTPKNMGLQEAVANSTDNLTTRERILRMDNDRQFGMDVKERADLKDIVHKQRREAFSQDLMSTFNDNKDQVVGGWGELKKGNVSGLGDVASGVAKMAGGAIADIADNKVASLEAMVAQAPQIAMAMAGRGGKAGQVLSNAGYGAQSYAEGIANYQRDHDGAYPPEAVRNEMKLWAAAQVGAEYAGEAATVKALMGGRKAAVKAGQEVGLSAEIAAAKKAGYLAAGGVEDVAAAAKDVALRTGFKESLKQFGLAGAEGFASEGATEAFQTYAEGQTKLDPVSGAEIFAGGVIGGVAGGGISGGGRALAELGGTTPEKLQRKAFELEHKETFDAAVKANDPAVFLDPEADTYSPETAVRVLATHSMRKDTAPDVREANLTQIKDISTGLENKLEDEKFNFSFQALPPEEQRAKIEERKATLATLDPESTQAQALTNIIGGLTKLAETPLTGLQLTNKKADIDRMGKELQTLRGVQENLVEETRSKPTVEQRTADVTLANTAFKTLKPEQVVEAKAAAKRLVSLGMADDLDENTALALAKNKKNSLDDDQRAYLRQFSEARIATNKLKTLDEVHQTVLTGDADNEGIHTYRKTITQALATNDQKTADKYMGMLQNFATSHSGKLAAVLSAFKEANTIRNTDPNATIQVVNTSDRGWERATERYTDSELTANGGLNISIGSNKLYEAIKTESSAVSATLKELGTAYKLTFAPTAPATSTVAPASVAPTVAPSTASAPLATASPTPGAAPVSAAPTTAALPTPTFKEAPKDPKTGWTPEAIMEFPHAQVSRTRFNVNIALTAPVTTAKATVTHINIGPKSTEYSGTTSKGDALQVSVDNKYLEISVPVAGLFFRVEKAKGKTDSSDEKQIRNALGDAVVDTFFGSADGDVQPTVFTSLVKQDFSKEIAGITSAYDVRYNQPASTSTTTPTTIPADTTNAGGEATAVAPTAAVVEAVQGQPTTTSTDVVDPVGDKANTRSEDPNDVLNLRADSKTFEYTNDQAVGLRGLTESMDTIGTENKWFLLNGKAGTGKTTIVENIVNAAKQKGRNVVVMAPSNKAVMVLKDKLKSVASSISIFETLHKAMYEPPEKKNGKISFTALKEEFKGLSNTTFLIDESSMVSEAELGRLRTAMEGTGNQFILLGDQNQLEPVGASPHIFSKESTIDFGKDRAQEYVLNEVRRQGLKSHILKFATYLAMGKKVAIPKDGTYEDLKIVPLAEGGKLALDGVIADPDNSVALFSKNEARIRFNNAVRAQRYGSNTHVLQEGEPLIGVANGSIIVNSQTLKAPVLKSGPVIVNLVHKMGTSKDRPVLRGEKYETDQGTLLLLPTLEKPTVPGDYFRKEDNYGADWMIATYAYGLTVHKSQGSQWNNVYVLPNFVGTWDPYKLLYTAITRAAKTATFGVDSAIFGDKRVEMSDVVDSTEEYIRTKGKSTGTLKGTAKTQQTEQATAPEEILDPEDEVFTGEPPPDFDFAPDDAEAPTEAPPVDAKKEVKTEAKKKTAKPAVKMVVAPKVAVNPAIVAGSPVEKGDLDGMAKENQTAEGTNRPYMERNLVADYLVQSVGGLRDKSQRPLVAVKNFISHLIAGNVKAEDYLGEDHGPLSDKEKNLLNVFQNAVVAWSPIIQQFMYKGARNKDKPEYWYKNPLNWLVKQSESTTGKKSFTVDENVSAAVVLAAMDMLLGLEATKGINDTAAINKILNRPVDSELPDIAHDLLGDKGMRVNLLRNSTGQLITDALGFKDKNDDTPQNLLPQLQWDMGVLAEKLLMDLGLVQRITIPGAQMKEVMDLINMLDSEAGFSEKGTSKEPVVDYSKTQYQFLRLASNKGKLHPDVQGLVEATKGTSGILSKLFSVESAMKFPSFTPIVGSQAATKAGMEIPSTLKEAQDANRERGTKADKDVWGISDQLDIKILEGIVGIEVVDETNTQINQLAGKKAAEESKRKGLQRYLDYMRGILVPAGLDQMLYFDFSVWNPQRVGIATNVINPQSDKTHRFAFFRESWESKVEFSKPAMLDNFFLRVGEGFGVKTDRQNVQKSLDTSKGFFTTHEKADVINGAIEALRANLYDQKAMSAEDQQNLLAAVRIGKQDMHTFVALIAMARYQQAVLTKADSFTTTIPSEVDGVANGPILAHALFGAAENAGALNTTLERGGISNKDTGTTLFNEWKANPLNKDLYENGIDTVVRIIQRKISEFKSSWVRDRKDEELAAIQVFTGNFKDDKNFITSDGRAVMKGPTTEMVFGAGVPKSISNMGLGFIDSVYSKFAKAAMSGSKEEVTKAINAANLLIQQGAWKDDVKPDNIALNADLMKIKLNPAQQASMRKAFTSVVGYATQEMVETNYAAFIERRKLFTATAGMVYGLYEAVYSAARDQLIKELIAREKVTPGAGIAFVVLAGKEQPVRDLSKKEEKMLRDRLKAMSPVVHTLFSKESNRLEAGLFIGKSKRRLSSKSTYKSEVAFNNSFADSNFPGVKPIHTAQGHALERVYEEPGVRMLPLMIHSLDSYILHMTQKDMDLLGVHDAAVAGLDTVHDVAKKMNQNTWHALLNYSPMTEMADALSRSVLGLAGLVESGDLPIEAASKVKEFLDNFAVENEYESGTSALTYLMQKFKAEAAIADIIKLNAMSEWVAVNQYARENGAYMVQAADKADAATKLTEVKSGLTAKETAALNYLAEKTELASKVAEEQQAVDESYDTSLEGMAINSASNAQAMTEVESASIDPVLTLDQRLQAREVLSTMWYDKKTLAAAALEMLGQSRAVGFIKMLSARFDANATKPVTSWGKLRPEGTAPLGSSKLIALLESRPLMTLQQVLVAVNTSLREDGKDPEMLDFYKKFLDMATKQRAFDSGLKVRYVTASTPENLVPDEILKGMSGQYTPTLHNDTIYIMGTEFVGSNITPELLLHELIHAALGWSVIKGRDDLIADSSSNSKEAQLVSQLESLRSQANDFLKGQDAKVAAKWKYALGAVQEMLAYGMGNKDFQNEVLGAMKVKGEKGKFITGLQAFVKTLTDFWFQGKAKPEHETGMDMLLHSVGGLLESAHERQIKGTLLKSMGMAAPSYTYSTQDVFTALDEGKISPDFSNTLSGLLDTIVEKLHGTFGSFKADLMENTPNAPLDVMSIAMTTGVAPFAFSALASAHAFSNQEAFVAEQIAATIQMAIDDKDGPTQAVRSELLKLYKEMKTKLNAESFHNGNWATATQSEKDTAQAKYDFIFKNSAKDANGNYTFLTNFAAMGLAHEGFNKLLRVPTTRNTGPVSNTPLGILKRAFDKVLEWANGKLTNTRPGQQADLKLTALVSQLVAIENKSRNTVPGKVAASAEKVEAAMGNLAEGVREKVVAVATSKFFKTNKVAAIRAIGSVTNMVAKDQLKFMVDNLKKVQESQFSGIPGITASLLTEFKGPKVIMQVLLQAAKYFEGIRKDIIVQTGKGLMNAFKDAGEHVSKEGKRSITVVALRTGAHVLMNHYDMAQIEGIVANNAALKAAITTFEGKLTKYPAKFRNYFINQSAVLGYHLATGETTGVHLMRNARNIASMYETPYAGRLSAAETNEATEVIDVLSTLYAIAHSNSLDRKALSEVMRGENARTDGNGVQMALLFHKEMEAQARANLFEGSETLMSKGYTPQTCLRGARL